MKTSDGAFRQIKGQHIGTLDLDVLTYEHIKTGAMHYHLQADHKENVFLVAFRTHPMDSTGVAHILEHTVLCGSQRYPVRDPFFMMIRRSLNTFMNAFTSSDYTAYPFASQNRNDYFNLLDVYLDAVFAPNLNELDFRQEGHRLEFETPDDPDSRLVYKGVVYNEMKGSNSSPDSLMYDLLKKHLFPETTYHYNSGGDPQVIPDLTYPEFLAFYKTHYHPSNAIFMTFGDIPVEEVQAIIEEKALCKFSVLDSKLTVAPETRLPKPISVIEPYSLDAGEDTDSQCHFVLSWLLGNSTNLMEQIQGHLLTDLLLDTSGSPLRHALESSGLGATISPLSGLEDSHREMSFICGLKGCRAEDADKIEALILETLETLARDGVPDERLDAVLYQLELHQREIGGDSYPYGLQLMFFCLSAAVHHADPIALLDLDSVIDTLHEEVKQPGYVQGLVKRLLLENTHRVRLLMVPDAQLSERLAQSERARLDTLLSKMTKADRQYLIEQTHLLKARQEAEDNVDLLPKVGIEDIPPDFTEPQPVESSLANRDRVSVYCAGTNGLVYQQLILPMPAVDAGFLSLLPLYTTALSEVGVAGRTYVETQLLQQAVSGGISAFSSFRPGLRNDDPLVAYLTVATRALGSSFEKASKLLMETILSPRFDETRHLLDLVKRMRVRREASLVRNGHLLAMHAASRNLSTVAALHHRLTGLASLNWIRQLEKQLDGPERTGELGNDLHALHQMMIQGPRQHLLISDEAHYHEALQILKDQYAGLGETLQRPAGLVDLPEKSGNILREAWTTTTQVNFCAAAFPTVGETHQDSAALTVLAGVLRNGYLHGEIREKGGAYGGGAVHDSSNGIFRFYSYRDPRLEETFGSFRDSVDWLLSSQLDFAQVEESILSIIGSLDSPGSPAGEARHAFHQSLQGRSLEHRKHYRESILSVSVADIRRVTETYLTRESSQVVITSQSHVQRLADQGFEIQRL